MIYFDHSATTPVTEEAKETILYYLDYFGNPSSHYGIGFEAKKLINKARKQIADSLGCEPEEIFFTSGGTEGDNWAIRSLRRPGMSRNRAIISSIEHHAVEYAASRLGEYKHLAVEPSGILSPVHFEEVVDAINLNEYGLASIMTVNNEIGTIQPIGQLVKIAHEHGLYFHTDAVQAVGHIRLNVQNLGVDMLTVSGHKFGTPKGVGFNYIKRGTPVRPFILGGAQENGMRAGTENVPYIMAVAQAFEAANKTEHTAYIRSTTESLWDLINTDVKGVKLNGSSYRIDSNLNICINGVDAQQLVSMMDTMHGICISTGSACNSGSPKPSHVLKAIGLSDNDANSSIRITLGAENTWAECVQFVKCLKYDVAALREE